MSGDVQPRKRKDKKRKKEDSTEQVPSAPQLSSPSSQNEDINIHVHKDEGTGGGICAKIVFFLLFSVLLVLIGLIITEHRGLTDLDTAEQESRFSHLFEGWVDNRIGHDDHDEDDHLIPSEEDEEHAESHEEEEDQSHDEEEEEHDEEEDHDEEEASEEIAQSEEEEEEAEASEEVPHTEEEEEDEEEEEQEETGEDEEETAEDEEEEPNVSEIEDLPASEENEEDQEAEPSAEDEDQEAELSAEDNVDQEAEDEVEEDQPASREAAAESGETNDEEAEEEAADQDGDANSKNINVTDDNEPEESESDKQSDADEYENITNKVDNKIKEKIDEAHANIQNNTAYAIKLFDVLLQNYSSSPRSLYGKAQALDVLADKKKSNDILQRAISTYLQVLALDDVPDALFEIVAERCINRMRFIGHHNKAIEVHQKLIDRFPNVAKYQNQLVVTYLTINRVNKARSFLQDILARRPNDGFALVHYGFILKTVDNNLKDSVDYLEKGIATKAPGVIDGRFYFHLGDALSRLGRTQEAMKIYEDGVRHKLFLSKYQRSLYNVARLKGQPWWEKQETQYSDLYRNLENNWRRIREEGIAVLDKNGQFQSESENLKDTGDWKQFELFARGQKNVNNCKKCPFTCQIIESMPAARGCKRGQTKFSVMHPGTHVWPHCGPTNCRLRVHLGLKVPSHTYIRVADQTRSWEEGKVLIFDDSFEHEVWHNGTSFRLVLIVDVWHPELTSVEKKSLSPI